MLPHSCCSSLSSLPSSGDRCLTELTPAIIYVEFGDIISLSFYQNLVTVMAISIDEGQQVLLPVPTYSELLVVNVYYIYHNVVERSTKTFLGLGKCICSYILNQWKTP